MTRQIIILLVVGLAIFLVSLTAYLFNKDLIPLGLIDFWEYSQTSNLENTQIINRQNESLEYKLNPKLFNYSPIVEAFRNTPLEKYKYRVSITDNPQDMMIKYAWQENELASGARFDLNQENETVEITIYLNPNLPSEKRQHELNKTYLVGLLYASEYWQEINPSGKYSYTANYQKARDITHTIMVDAYDQNDYFLTEINEN